jgi:hypothetical protein
VCVAALLVVVYLQPSRSDELKREIANAEPMQQWANKNGTYRLTGIRDQ